MHLRSVVLSLFVVSGLSAQEEEPKSVAEAARVSFHKEIRPLFQAHCSGCHQPAKRSGGYEMTTFANLLKGGDSTLAGVVPGKPEESYLIEEITPVDGKADMPKDKPPLAKAEIDLIRQWIKEGAVDDSPENTQQQYDSEHPPKYTLPPVIPSIAYSPDGKLLAVAGYHEVLLHNADGSGLVGRLVGVSERIESVRFSPDGKLLAVAGGLPGRAGEIQIWDVATRKLTLSYPVTYDTVYGASWSPDSKKVAFGAGDNVVRAIDIESGKQILFQGSHDGWVLDTVWSVKGTHVMSVSRDMTTKLTEVATERFVDNITSITPGALKGGITSIDRHPTRDNILVGGSDGVPKVYRVFRKTARRIGDDANLIREFPAMKGRIFAVDYSNDGKMIAAGSSLNGAGMVRIYASDFSDDLPKDIAAIVSKVSTQQNAGEKAKLRAYLTKDVKTLHTLDFPENSIYALSFNPAGDRLVVAGADGKLRFVDVATGKVVKEFLPVTLEKDETTNMASAAELKPSQEVPETEPLRKNLTISALEVTPTTIELTNRYDYAQLIVQGRLSDGTTVDLTRHVKYTPTADVVGITTAGLVRPNKEGACDLQVTFEGHTKAVPVKVTDLVLARPISWTRDVNPVISKLGCNAGTCHGAKDGKNGFKLSLRGYDPIYDIRAFTDDLISRRVNLASPHQSLMLLKATGSVPHVGGQLTQPDEIYYDVISRWIAQGAKLDLDVPKVASIEILPVNPVVQRIGDKQQMRVIATYTDGKKRDVTQEAFIDSGNGDIAKSSPTGLVTTLRRGEAPVLARFEGAYVATTVTVMGDRSEFQWVAQPTNSQIDKLVHEKLQRMKILPSGLCTDAEFIRRVYLDLTALPPSPEDVKKFLDDQRDSKVKRQELIDKLIKTEAFTDFWTSKWADMLQVNRKFLGGAGAKSFHEWIRNEVKQNTPYDQFAYKILTASGSNKTNPPASYYKTLRTPADTMENTTHLFLAIRFNCNKCHDHPFERWTQDQYYETAAYFARVGLKRDPASGKSNIGGTAVEGAKPLYEIIYEKNEGEITHDRTGAVTAPDFPFEASYEDSDKLTRREELAKWITSPDNPYFARSYVNRIWGYLMGVGLIEPLDDIRAGNPPSNPELLDYLTEEFITHQFDTQHLIRIICNSRTYQLSLETNRWNKDDHVNFSHATARRLPAEVLFDAIHQATGSQTKIPGVPAGTLAVQVYDAGIKLPGGFGATLGRPARESSCECERSNDLQLGPVMKLVGGPVVGNAISDPNNAIAKLVASESNNVKLVDALFMRILNRPATDKEIGAAIDIIKSLEAEHKDVVASLKTYEAKIAPERNKLIAARQQKIDAAQAAVDAYKKQIAAREAKLDAEQKARIAKAEAELAAYEKELAPRVKQWASEQTGSIGWQTITPKEMTSTNNAKLERQDDGSIFVSGPEGKTVYNLVTETDLQNITGIRIEALTDDRLGAKGPGRPGNGNFVLTEFEVFIAPKADPTKKTKVTLTNARATFSQGNYDVKSAIDGNKTATTNNGWAIAPQLGKNQTAVFETQTPTGYEGGSILSFAMSQNYQDNKHALGKFRISITTDATPLKFGLPKEVNEILALTPEKRTEAHLKKLEDYYRSIDGELKRRKDAVATAKKPRPIDPKLKTLNEKLTQAQTPLPTDPQLERLQRAVQLSEEQLKNPRLTAAQDIAWALINTPAFLFNR